MKKTKIGIIGCGNICDIYFQAGKTFRNIEIAACADMLPERAKAKAEQHGVARPCSVTDLLKDPEIEIVLNLTIPKAHVSVGLAALEAGKHVYGEKPLGISREEGKKLMSLAKSKGLRVGSAPDTFLGGGHQTCRKLIDDGWIGEPVAATAFMLCPGHESWHPSPEFYYEVGGGPMFDMGPYYLTALVNMLGPIKRITGSARITHPTRTITSQPKYGKVIDVETPTHIAGVMDFASGAVGTIITSFDIHGSTLPCIEIYGTRGTMIVPDPNGFGGAVRIKRAGSPDWMEIPLSHGFADNSRGIGVADMAAALQSGRKHRANGDLAFHVLDAMESFLNASSQNRHIELETTCERPEPLPLGLPKDSVEL